MQTIETVVVGAGVIGLAVARALALAGQEVVVLEAEASIGTVTSSRNSEVIHAGIYYPTDSNKARFSVAGKPALYRFCAEHGVAHDRCGKLIVAADRDQADGLAELKRRAAANGVPDLRFVDRAELALLEPEITGARALLSPSTGIIDSHGFMLALQGDAEAAGTMVAFLSPLRGGRVVDGGFELEVGGREPTEIRCRRLVNAAGLEAQATARRLTGVPAETIPPLYYSKGSYYTLSGRSSFRHLIYPMPEPGGLGVHLSIDLAGQARFGPDVEWVDAITYDVDPARADGYYRAVRRYWPGLADGALKPDYAGIRPKLVPAGAPAGDFLVQGPGAHGIAGLVNLYGIESPGLTASLAIADHVAQLLHG